MADAAAARREARRRKILENSQNRLKLITGESTELMNDVNVEQVVNNDSTIIQNSHIIEQPLREQPPQQQQPTNEFDSLFPINKPTITTTTPTSTNTHLNNLFDPTQPYSRRILIVLLAILIRLLFIFQMQFCVRDSIIYPFIVAEVTLIILNKDQVTGGASGISPLLNTILLFSSLPSVPSVQINRFMRVFTFFDHFIQDFSLYFVTFIAVHLTLTPF